jgi:hypothetical protein
VQCCQTGCVTQHPFAVTCRFTELLNRPDCSKGSRAGANGNGGPGKFVWSFREANHPVSCQNTAVLAEVSIHIGDAPIENAPLAERVYALIGY